MSCCVVGKQGESITQCDYEKHLKYMYTDSQIEIMSPQQSSVELLLIVTYGIGATPPPPHTHTHTHTHTHMYIYTLY